MPDRNADPFRCHFDSAATASAVSQTSRLLRGLCERVSSWQQSDLAVLSDSSMRGSREPPIASRRKGNYALLQMPRPPCHHLATETLWVGVAVVPNHTRPHVCDVHSGRVNSWREPCSAEAHGALQTKGPSRTAFIMLDRVRNDQQLQL